MSRICSRLEYEIYIYRYIYCMHTFGEEKRLVADVHFYIYAYINNKGSVKGQLLIV